VGKARTVPQVNGTSLTRMERFTGKVALLSGAASGMGRAVSVRLAAEGATVIGVDVNQAGLDETAAMIDSAGGAFSAQTLDVTDVADITATVNAVAEENGRLDVLGNIAGIHPRIEAVGSITEEMWDRYIDVNLKSVFFLCQAALPHIVAAEGNIVNIASNAGLQGLAYSVPYCASKGGVVQLTKALAVEYLKHPIRVNAIAPGGTQTALTRDIELQDGVDFDLVMRAASPRGMDTVESVAALFAHLASDEASNMHGSIVSADSGLVAG